MAWTYEQDFNALTTGDLNGQDSWAGDAAFDVQTSVVYEGAKAVSQVTAGAASITRAVTGTSTGNFYIAVRKSSASVDNLRVILQEAGTSRMYLLFLSDGTINYFDGTQYQSLGSYVANQWYLANFEWDDAVQPNLWRIRIYDGSWGVFSSWAGVNGGAYTVIDGILFDADDNSGGTTNYWDVISITDPTAGPVQPDPSFRPSILRPHIFAPGLAR